MQLALVLMTEAAGRMVTGEAAGLAEEDREDIKLPLHYLTSYKSYKVCLLG